MNKHMLPGTNALVKRFTLAFAIFSTLLFSTQLYSQCGTSPFVQGGTLTPTTTWTNVSVGSGTYINFNVTNGNFYSFRYTTTNSNLGGSNLWDMTLSNSSTALAYNNSLTPINDSWTGGAACPNSTSPTSAEWYSTFTGLLRVNTKTDVSGTCTDWVSGQNSAVLQYKTCAPAADPGSGNGVWNVEAFATTDIAIPNTNARYGYYVDNALNFVTSSKWAIGSNPSTAAGWAGCGSGGGGLLMPNDNFTIRARRTGFPCDLYKIYVNNADDNIRVYVNGSQIYSATCCVNSTVQIGNAAGYVLSSTDVVEIRLMDECASGQANVSFVAQTVPALTEATIGSNQTYCGTATPAAISGVAATGGYGTAYANGSYTYDWKYLDGCVPPVTSVGLNSTSIAPPSLTATRCYIRTVEDKCGNVANSNTVTITINNPSTAPSSIAGTNLICNGQSTTLTVVGGSLGTGASWQWYTGSCGGTPAGTGTSITVSPTNPTTTYYVRAEGTCGNTTCAQVTVTVNNPSVAPTGVTGTTTICNGGTTTLTVAGGSLGTGADWAWYSGSCGGSFVGNGPSITISPSTTTTYFVRAVGSAPCTYPTACASATVTVNTLSVAPTSVSGTTTICEGSSTNLTVVGGSLGTGGVWTWYTGSCGGTPAGTGSTLTVTPAIATNYFVRAEGTCNTTSCTNTSVTINDSSIVASSITGSPAICIGGSTNLAAVGGRLGVGANWRWYSGSCGGTLVGTGTPISVSPTTTTTYYLRAEGLCNTTVCIPFTVTVNPLPNGSISGSATVCYGVDTSVTFNLSVGATPSTVVYTDGTNTFTKTNVSNGDTIQVFPLTTTTYTIQQITDNNGCVRSTGFLGAATVTVAPLPVVSNVVETDVLCNGGNTGKISVTASSGTPTYTYSNDNGVTYQNSNTFTGLVAATYPIIVKDALACKSTPAYPVVVNEPTALSHTATPQNASCDNVFDGSISVSASGGILPYSYSLNGGPTQPGNVFNGLSAGTYTVLVTDYNACTNSSSVTIDTAYAVYGSLVSQTAVSCFGGVDGTVTVQLAGGVPPYAYSINGVQFVASPTFTGLASGNYVVTLRDSKGCTDFVNVTIAQPNQLQAQIDSVINIGCSGASSGAIYITISGGNPNYSFLWSNGAVSEDVTGLTAGTYNVAITDSKGCTASVGATISQPLPLFANIASYNDLRCFNDSTGSIDVTVNGGVPPYSFAWSNGNITEDLTNLDADNYSLTVTDANGCQQFISKILTEPAILASSSIVTNLTCNSSNNGAIDLSVTGGTSPYAYLWSNGLVTEDLTAIAAGTYTVVITDAHGCGTSNTSVVTQPDALLLTTIVTNAGCNGAATGAIDLEVTGGTGAYTYSWTGGGATQDTSGLLAGIYSVTVTDANNCTATASATISQPAQALGSTISAIDVTCYGASDGTVNLTVTGGTQPYSYSWSNSANTEDLTGLGPDTYSVTITDANLCTTVTSIVVNEPDTLVATIVGTNVSCFGGNDGAADLTVTGGNGGYVYLWSNFAGNEDLSSLTAGNYVVIVNDAKGCQAITSVVIAQPTQLFISGVVTNVLCNGAATGEINLTVSGGTGAYTYAWTGGGATEDTSGLVVGTYSVTVTDANNCTATATYTITQPTALVLNATTTDVGCAGGANGSVDITVQGGVFPYSFAWSNGLVTEDVNGLSGGSYTVTITDANGCTIEATYTIDEPTAITSTLTGTNVTCNGASNGSTDLTVGGGTAPYTFLWSTFQSTEDLTNIPGGTYYVIIKDANGCEKRDSIVITEPNALVLTTTVTNVLCNGAATGAIDLEVTGGTGAYTYSWTGGGATQDTTGLLAGTYSVTVTDANNCTATTTVTVTQPTGLVLNATTTDVGCAGGANGSVDITVQGGVFPYSFAWSNGLVTEDVNGLSGGSYTVTITDANGCTIEATYTIDEPTAITSTLTGTNVTCNGASNGSTDLTVGGGTAPYTFLWSTFQSTEDLTNIPGGTYYVIIKDANGCEKRDSIVITEPNALVLTTTVTNVLCNGAATGAIDLEVTGGTGAYTYSWTGGGATQDTTGLLAGTYSVTVTDANNCTATTTVTVTQPTGLVLNATTTDVGCAGGANGSVDITVQGGVFPYSFAWSNGPVTEDVNGLSGGSYTVTITDANGCTIEATYTIDEPTAITSTLTGTNVTCNGASNGSTNLTVGGGTAPYTFLWSTFQSTEDLTNIPGGTYYVIIKDANGCEKRDSIVITEPNALVLTTTVTNVLCNGAATGGIDLEVTGGTGAYTYAWTGGGATQDTTGLLAGTYSVTVTDANNCTATTTVTVTQPTGLVLNATTTDVGCAGGANGSVDITVQGGVFPYSFAWSNGPVTEDVNGLSGGSYTVTITDANGCTIEATYTIDEPTAITSTLTGTNVTCNGASNGSTNLTVGGGTAPYTFLWSTFQSIEDLSGLTAGTYFVIIKDANGCEKRDSIVITEPTAIILSTTVTNVLCSGNPTGGVNLTVAGGTTPYDYTWSNGANTQDLTNVVAGTYCVTVKDGNNCTATVCATISQPDSLLLTGTATNVLCFNGNNGLVNTTVVGGTLPYTFVWSNGANTEDIQNLTAGTYAVTVTDANGCSATASYNITSPTAITSFVVGTDVLCQGGNTGSANLTVSGGTPGYTFFWSNFQISEDATNLGGGTYYVVITDANGCTRRDSVTINEPAQLNLTTQVTQISCFNVNDGAINLTVAGGTTPYQYIWNNGATTEDISNLSGATYCVTVTDDNGCSATVCELIINPSNISTSAVITNPLCFGDANGSIDLVTAGGTPNYTFLWNTGDATEDISSIDSGVYSIIITDDRGCTRLDTFVVTEPSALFTSGFINNVTCFGLCDGFADITAYGGTLPYTYVWSTGQSTEDIGNLCGNDYFVTVTDAHACSVVSLYIVKEPALLTLNVTTTNVSCFDGKNGTLTAFPGGGSTPYEYVWDDFNTDSARVGLEAGHYVLLLTDSNGCHIFDSVDITQPTEIAITGTVTDANCFGASTGAIDVTVNGGIPAYTYLWTGGVVTEDLATAAAGVHTISVTDANQCVKTKDFTIGQPSQINLTLLTNKPTCNGASNGSVSVVAIQGVTPYTYAWNTTPAQTTATASDLFAGSYTVTVTDNKGCTAVATDSLIAPTKIVVSTNATGSKCFNTATGVVEATVTGGLPPYVYQLNGVTQDSNIYYGLLPGNYILLVTDANSCQGTASFAITSPSQISVSLSTNEQIILTGMKTQLVAAANSTQPIIGYMWTPDSLMDYSICGDPANCSNPYAAPRSTTIFAVTVMNSDSCTATDTITIYVDNELSAFIPTAFTPNGDGMNDRFEFDILGATNLDVTIYNRWGQQVYANAAQPNGINGSNGWDGKVDGKDAPFDTYVWKMTVTYFDGTTRDNTGTVTLMK